MEAFESPPWDVAAVRCHRGGPVIVDRRSAPLGLRLPYRRALGESPPATDPPGGWTADLGSGWLGDALLGLGLVQGLHDADPGAEIRYSGPLPKLMDRCTLPLVTRHRPGRHIARAAAVRSAGNARFRADPESSRVWLDLVTDDAVAVHSALPMRYYLQVEHAVGHRLPADRDPLPRFVSSVTAPDPFHVVIVDASSMPDRKRYGVRRFVEVAAALMAKRSQRWTFTVITGRPVDPAWMAVRGVPVQVLGSVDAVDCLDVFASAQLVVGNDTGLVHLAALTARADGTGPDVVGLYSRHSFSKWTTGSPAHHAVATPFSQMMAVADADAYRDGLDDILWGTTSELDRIDPATVAAFAGQVAGWW